MYITEQKIHPEAFYQKALNPSCGAQVSFFGVVRDHNHGRCVTGIVYFCYVALANKEIGRIIREIKSELAVQDISVRHRIGALAIGDVAVGVIVSSPHRQESFCAGQKIMDAIKQRVPIWKKEFYADGTSEWILCSCHERIASI